MVVHFPLNKPYLNQLTTVLKEKLILLAISFKGTNEIPMHRTQEERCRAAKKMAKSVDLSGFYVAVDTMLNCANIAYGAVPIRLYVVQNKTIAYAGGAGPMKYKMREVMLWLQDYRVNTMLSQSPWDAVGSLP